MRRRIALPALTVAAVGASLLVVTQPAYGHGYVSSPASRQAHCARGTASNCGQIIYEPHSVEGLKGFPSRGPADGKICSGAVGRFSELDRTSGWPATSVSAGGRSVTWTIPVPHSTAKWDYYITNSGPTVSRANLTKIATFNDGGRVPSRTVTHSINVPSRSGRQVILATWDIADTGNAFYACIDVDFGGGNPNPPTTPPTTTPPTTTPPTTRPPTTPPSTTTPPQTGTWTPGTAYAVGDRVTYSGRTYQCRQAHTALNGWEPPNVPALWLAV